MKIHSASDCSAATVRFSRGWLHRGVATALTAALLLPWMRARAADAPSKTAAAAEYEVVTKEFDAAQEGFSKIYQQAKTDEERQEAVKKYPQPEKYSDRLLKVATQHPQDPAAFEALLWIVTRAGQSPAARTALARLTSDHITHEKLAPACFSQVYSQDEGGEKFLRAALEKNPSREVQGAASLCLAQRLSQRGGAAEATKLFEQVVEKFSDIQVHGRSLGDQAKSELFETRNLSVGKEAPDIAGADVDGVKFKLSDYRGKVVVIDFWGDW